jgi:hypothetical protein
VKKRGSGNEPVEYPDSLLTPQDAEIDFPVDRLRRHPM